MKFDHMRKLDKHYRGCFDPSTQGLWDQHASLHHCATCDPNSISRTRIYLTPCSSQTHYCSKVWNHQLYCSLFFFFSSIMAILTQKQYSSRNVLFTFEQFWLQKRTIKTSIQSMSPQCCMAGENTIVTITPKYLKF